LLLSFALFLILPTVTKLRNLPSVESVIHYHFQFRADQISGGNYVSRWGISQGSQQGVRIQFFVLVSVLILATFANGQSSLATGRVEGTVVDSSGAAVEGSTVLVENQDTGISITQKSDSSGRFVFLNVPPGSYQVTVQKPGFKIDVSKGVQVNVGTTTNLQRELIVGAQDMTVSVVAEVPLVDTTQSGLSAVVDQRAISTLPLNGRNFTDFVKLTPGASTDGDFGMISFNGLAGNYNNYTVDGANDNNAFFEQQSDAPVFPSSSAKISSRNSRSPAPDSTPSLDRRAAEW
jgi:hypothetical protein